MTIGNRLAYGVLGAPLAMAALPVYIHTPKLYGDEFGLGLALTGLILRLSRTVDTLQDPWLGRLADCLQHRPGGWTLLVSIAVFCLGLSYTALFNPPSHNQMFLPVWFAVTLVLVYTAHSALNITYLAWGASASEDTHERTRLVAFREGFSLLGVVLASLLPMLFADWFSPQQRWLIFSLVLALAAGLALPLWAGLGYQPGAESGLFALAICYAGIPSVIKLIAAALLIRWRSSLEITHATESRD